MLQVCPHPLTEQERVYYLIRGLNWADHYSILMAAPPATVSALIDSVRRLEANGMSVEPTLPQTIIHPLPTNPDESFQKLADRLVVEISKRMAE